jgi:DNA-binding transcriptional MerR regulator
MTSPGTGLMSIGSFARLCRLTVKAVRHYDAEGLLVPAEVDPHSGYRYYRAEQVRTATTIALLRGLDVPLTVVRDVLAAPDPAAVADVLAAQRERWAAELARREQVLRSLDVLLHRPERVRYDVAVADRPVVRLTGVDGVVRADHLDSDVGALCVRALRSAPRGEPLVAVFPVDLADTMPVTVGLPPTGPGRRSVHDAATELPGGPWAATLHVGPYEELPLAYTALLEHVRDLGHDVRGPVTETYLADPSTAEPADLVTRVAVALGDGAPAG